MIEQAIRYQIKATCRQEDEAHVRFVILQSVARGPLVLHSLRSQDQSVERNEVIADIECLGRNDSLLEDVVSHLSMEKGVSSVAWSVLSNGASVSKIGELEIYYIDPIHGVQGPISALRSK